MPHIQSTHDENRRKVCAVCCNNRGNKAVRTVNESEELIIRSEVIKGYSKENPYLPSGLCKGCVFDLKRFTEGKPVKLQLPDSYDCGLGRQMRSAGTLCSCKWCWLARLNFIEFKKWQKEVTGKTREPVVRMCQSCFLGIQEGKSHKCSASTLESVRNLAASLPKDIREKLVVEALMDKAADSGGDMKLPQAKGGHLVHVHLGSVEPPKSIQMGCQDVLTMAASAHLTGKQTDSVLADIRAVFGRKSIEPGLKDARVAHNGQYREFFSAARVNFSNTKGEQMLKPFFWCSKLKDFLASVANKRGRNLEECTLKIGADSGKGFFKLTASMYIPGSQSQIETKKRRSREDGVCDVKFSETGQRKILLLAWCKDIPETAENLEIVYNAVNISSVKFIMTGDYKLLMPSFGLMSCSSTHPCLYCARSRIKGLWQEDVDPRDDMLRTFARNEIMYGDWNDAGAVHTTHFTSQFESVTGPVLVWGKDDTPSTRILDKVTPPTVHNLLALNSVLRPHLSNLWEGDMMKVLKDELNIVPHSYQGKEGAFAGPECNKFLNNLEMFEERLTASEDLTLFYNFFCAFKNLKDGTFGSILAENWRDLCVEFRSSLFMLNSCLSVPITPKLHVMATHIEEWLESHGRSMGDDSEQALESSHGRFSKVWESYQVRDENSEAFLKNGLAAGLHFNADNSN